MPSPVTDAKKNIDDMKRNGIETAFIDSNSTCVRHYFPGSTNYYIYDYHEI